MSNVIFANPELASNAVAIKFHVGTSGFSRGTVVTIRGYYGENAETAKTITSDIAHSGSELQNISEAGFTVPYKLSRTDVGKTLVFYVPAPIENESISVTMAAIDTNGQQVREHYVDSIARFSREKMPTDVVIGDGDEVLNSKDMVEGKAKVTVKLPAAIKEGETVFVKTSEGEESDKLILTADDLQKGEVEFYVDAPETEGATLSVEAFVEDIYGNPSAPAEASATLLETPEEPAPVEPEVPADLEVDMDIDPITGDDVISASELNGNVAITGTVQGPVQGGETVTVTAGGKEYTTTLNEDGTFSVDVPALDLAKDAGKVVSASVELTQPSGNTEVASAAKGYDVDVPAANVSIALDNVTADNIISAVEAKGNVAVTGKVAGDFKAGDEVVVALDANNTYKATVDAQGKFSVSVEGAKLVADADKALSAAITVKDALGNTATAEAVKAYSVNTKLPEVAISLDNIAGDNIINAAEAKGNIVVSGKVTGDFKAGDNVVIALDDKTFYTRPVDAKGNFSASIPAARLLNDADKALKATISVKDTLGNTATAEVAKSYAVDTKAPEVAISLNNIAGDNIINAAEAKGNIVVSGNVTGDFKAGDKVVIALDDKTFFTRSVDAKGNFSASIPAKYLLNDADKALKATISVKDAAGNTATAQAVKSYAVDTQAPEVEIALNNITADNIINAAEAKGNVTVSGVVSGEFNAGDKVVVALDANNAYTTTVDANGNFAVSVPGAKLVADADKTLSATVTTKDVAGNVATATAQQVYGVDTVAPNAETTQIALNNITADNTINWEESKGIIPVSGKVTGEFNPGDQVVIALDANNTYTTTVDANGNFSVNVPGAKLVADADKKLTATLTTTDAAGNTGIIEAAKSYGVDVEGTNINLRALDGDLTMYYGLSRWEYNRGGAGDTVARGDSKNPFLTTDNNDKVIIGGLGSEKQGGGSVSNWADYGAAARLTDGSASISTVDLGKGDDFLHVRGDQQQATRVYLGEGDDVYNLGRKLTAANAGDLTSAAIFGEEGNDTINVGGSIHNSWIYGGSGSDTINIGYGPIGGGSLVGKTVIDLGSGKVMPAAYNSVYLDGSARSLGSDNNKDSVNDVNKLNIKNNVDPGAEIYGGAGKDLVKVEGFFNGKMDLGSNDDVLTVNRIGFKAGKVDGGEGNDTVIITGKDNLLSLSQFVRVETIDLTGAGKNTLRITGEEAKNTGTDVFIKGDRNDLVDFGVVSPGKAIMHEGRKGSWSKTETVSKDGVMYDGYSFSGNNMEDPTIYVQQGIMVV